MIKVKGRWYSTTIPQILKRLDVQQGVSNDEYTMICCPFHKEGKEKRPSACVYHNDGHLHCFACKTTRTISEIIEQKTDTNAKEWLRANFGAGVTLQETIELLSTKKEKKTESTPFLPIPYKYTHEPPKYVLDRGITYAVAKLFDIGYKDNKVVFPMYNKKGEYLYCCTRNINSKRFYIPKDVLKPLYGEHIIQQEYNKGIRKPIYVCEGFFDCLSLWSWGYWAIALLGLGSKEQYPMLQNLPGETLILALDNDIWGERASKHIMGIISNKRVYRVRGFNQYKDINEMTQEYFKENCYNSIL